jgi:hypothetical protein
MKRYHNSLLLLSTQRMASERYKHDPFRKSIRYLKENPDAYQAYLNAMKSSRHWASQGMEDWAQSWERHAQNIAKAGPKWPKIKVPHCVHPPNSYNAEGRVRPGRRPHNRSPMHSGVGRSGGLVTQGDLVRIREKRETAMEDRRLQEGRLIAYAKEVAAKAKKKTTG